MFQVDAAASWLEDCSFFGIPGIALHTLFKKSESIHEYCSLERLKADGL